MQQPTRPEVAPPKTSSIELLCTKPFQLATTLGDALAQQEGSSTQAATQPSLLAGHRRHDCHVATEHNMSHQPSAAKPHSDTVQLRRWANLIHFVVSPIYFFCKNQPTRRKIAPGPKPLQCACCLVGGRCATATPRGQRCQT